MKDDLKVQVQCTFSTTFIAHLTPEMATAIVTLTPSATDSKATSPPELAADIRTKQMELLTSVSVGEPIIVYVYFLNNQSTYIQRL